MNAFSACLNHFSKITTYLAIMLWLSIVPALDGIASSKRVAVLYFDNHSRFDSATGCGCIPNPFGIFGTGKGRTKWNLKEGFPELLNRKLKQTQVYEPVSNQEVKDAMAQQGLSLKAVRSNAEKRKQLAKALNVEAFIVGDIQKFNQERAKATRFQTLKGSGGGFNMAAGFVGGAQLIGYYYSATVHLKMKFYGSSGDEIAKRKIAATKRHQLGGAKFAALEAVVSEQGTELQLGQMPNPQKKIRPIVSYAKLDQIEFASPEYDRTLFGHATDDALTKVVLALRDTIGPEFIMPGTTASQEENPSSTSSSELAGPLRADVIYVNSDDPADAYINAGSSKGILVRQQLTVYTAGEPLIDPDTQEILGNVPKIIGKVEVVEVKTDRLSRVRVIEGLGVIKKGDKVEGTEPSLSEIQAEN
jgi:hypothetical protein